MIRRKTRQMKAGNVPIGSDYPVTIQSMVNIPSYKTDEILSQIRVLENARCDLVRIAIPDENAAEIFRIASDNNISVPLIADIHFDYKLAVTSAEKGANKIRINPGNIGEPWKIREVVNACSFHGLPIRIGVNSGSVEKKLLEKYGGPTADALAESALNEAEILESFGFSDIVISIKSSKVNTMVEAVSSVASRCDYPLHIGVTEAGDSYDGIIKNSIGIGTLLSRGIGDTVRVSLTADPTEEVKAARGILGALDLSVYGRIDVISCPTCGRTRIDLHKIVNEYKKMIDKLHTNNKKVTVAIMGCAVNGPGEAREADFGIAGGDGFGLFFVKGTPKEKVSEDKIVEKLFEETIKFIES